MQSVYFHNRVGIVPCRSKFQKSSKLKTCAVLGHNTNSGIDGPLSKASSVVKEVRNYVQIGEHRRIADTGDNPFDRPRCCYNIADGTTFTSQLVTSSKNLLQSQISSYNGSVGDAMDSFVAIIMPKERVSCQLEMIDAPFRIHHQFSHVA